MIDEAYNICIREKNEYMSNRFKKWFVFGFGVVLSVGLAYAITEFVSIATNAVYDRSGLEEGTD